MFNYVFQNATIPSDDTPGSSNKLEDLSELVNSKDRQNSVRAAQQQAYIQDLSDRLVTMQIAVNDSLFLDSLFETMDGNLEYTLTAMQTLLLREKDILTKEFLTTGIERLREQANYRVKITVQPWYVTGLEVNRGYLLGGDMTRVAMWRNKLVLMLEMKDEEVCGCPTVYVVNYIHI